MNTRGQGRVFQRGAYLWVAYYAHGKELREAARHVRTGDKLEATEKNQREAERFLKHRLGELAAEQHGGRAFVGPQQESRSTKFWKAWSATINCGTGGTRKSHQT